MSDPKGDHPAQAHGSGRRPSFDRPSLFAGMEEDDASDDTRRVRILSTLESTRQATRPGRIKGRRRGRPSKPSSWPQRVLWGVLGLGVLTLMAGFVMVIQDGKSAMARTSPPPAAPLAQARQDAVELPKLASTGPAVIETNTMSAAPGAAPLVDPPQASASLASNRPETKARPDKTPPSAPRPATVAKSGGQSPAHASKGQDEDVALLEAMFAHTGRKAAPTPSSPKN